MLNFKVKRIVVYGRLKIYIKKTILNLETILNFIY